MAVQMTLLKGSRREDRFPDSVSRSVSGGQSVDGLAFARLNDDVDFKESRQCSMYQLDVDVGDR